MIHDSYGTHACNTDLMHACIRDAFVQQYSGGLLDKFAAEIAGRKVNALTAAITKLDKAVSHHAEGDAYDHAKNARDTIVPCLVAIREAADELETIVADDLWPLPTYREMLFMR